MKTRIRRINRDELGQALVELSLAIVVLCVFVSGIVDFGRAIYDVQVMKNLVGEGSMMASRSSSVATTVQSVTNYAGSDINLSTQGCVIVTQVTNQGGGVYQITDQASQCAISASSKVGCLKGQGGCQSSSAVLPPAAVTALLTEPVGSSVYVTEIYYSYKTVTPIAALLKTTMPSQFYSVAYY
jgi:Flp pilus assembly protein TadG